MDKLKRLLILIALILTTSCSAFTFIVHADSDKTQLNKAYEDIQTIFRNQDNSTIENPYYEPNSYQAFIDRIDLLGGVSKINDVINDSSALQVDVDNLTNNINIAIDGLVLFNTYNSILDKWTVANNIDLTKYTPNSQLTYSNELNRIKVIIDNPTSGETIIAALNDDIINASLLLIQAADKTNLNMYNNLLIKAYYEDINLYTSNSHDIFINAVDKFGSYMYVNQVLADENVTQFVVDQLENDIIAALDLLVLKADNTNLLTVYYDLEARDLSMYSADSQTEYHNKLNEIYLDIISSNLDETLANQVLVQLSNISDVLIELPDYSQLQAKYDFSQIFRSEDYSISSYQAFIDAQNQALVVLNNKNATQTLVDQTLIDLNDAINKLTPKLDTIYLTQGNQLDINQYVVLGKASIVSYLVEDNNVLTIDKFGVVKALDFGKSKVYIDLSNGATEKLEIFVKAKPTTVVYILTFSVPVIGAGLAIGMIYIKSNTINNLYSSTKKMLKIKKH